MKLQQLKLDWPTNSHIIAQKFGGNANPLYSGQGLKGHPGLDIDAAYDNPIYSISRGKGRIYKIFNRDNKDLMKYRAVCELIDCDDYTLEITYGHCNKIDCIPGQSTPAEQIATVGNTGEVYNGNHKVTETEKENGSTAGRHLHLQFRECIKTKTIPINLINNFLADDSNQVYVDSEGYRYCIPEYNNGYNGCIDPLPFLQTFIDTQITDEAVAKQLEETQLTLIDVLKQFVDYLKQKLRK